MRLLFFRVKDVLPIDEIVIKCYKYHIVRIIKEEYISWQPQ